jgi:3-hydroxyisobutyrate dehydrogenase
MTGVAILGLGAMGARMAARLLAGGHAVTVWNRTPERATPLVDLGARAAKTAPDAVAGASIVIAIVRDDDASRAVWLDPQSGALPALAEGAIAIESSTLSHAWTLELAAKFKEHGRAFLDAPVVGSRPQAEAGQLIHLVGGDQALLEQATPVLAAIGGARHWCGDAGTGTAMKLAVNSLFGIQIAALAELANATRKLGVEPARLADVLGATPVLSPAGKGALGLMLAQAYAPMFPLELAEKDFRYALTAAAENNAATPVTEAVRVVLRQGIAKGFGGDNLTGICRLYQ